jgi:thiol-disulfide isomerase/thioredoxin
VDVLAKLGHTAKLPSFDGATSWLNSEPLTPGGLQGRVVLVQFWTFTCINWLRTLPYVRAWNERYRDRGLVVIGVHTPEFEVEHELSDIVRAMRDMRIEYPVAVDNDYGVWDAFENRYWPALYVADGEGAIRYHHFGEGRYEETERELQSLLGVEEPLSPVEGEGAEAPADWNDLESPETYVGYARSERFADPADLRPNERHAYTGRAALGLNTWSLGGEWVVGRQAGVAAAAGAAIAFRFHARDLHLVMGAGGPAEPVPFRVLLDGEPPGPSHGVDVDAHGRGAVSEPRLYQLVRQHGPIADRTCEITFLEGGAEALVFTFG